MSNKKNSNEHIKVYIRCRPLTKSELSLARPVEVHPEVNKILVRDTGSDKSTVKSFTFDKVFGPKATQEDIYNDVVAPVVEEVILGFNCTIFAYGQTGTGKTYTIEGSRSSCGTVRSEDPLAGIIPRSMKHLFDELTGQNMECEICVSFLELYNEEIFDLLTNTDEPTKLKIFDNASQKGSVIIQRLQIVSVKSMKDVYTILDKGCKKRRKANTLLNKSSSRSHTVFTVTVNIKESSSTLEKVKCGKLNLVDLAGSENIGRSGASELRAREAGNINQSLLALGRVITSLCEKAGHIPYRESKLTRLLQDSLGGQTKTAVIATISPSAVHVDETLNTLEYALRAKNITNKPELNSQFTVNSLLQDYLEEIHKLNKRIHETGMKNSFYFPEEHIKHWESTLASKREEKFKILSQIQILTAEDSSLDSAINEASNALNEKKAQLENTKLRVEEYKAKLEKAKQEKKLRETTLQVMRPLSDCLHKKLHESIEEKQELESETSKMKEKYKRKMAEHRIVKDTLQDIREKRKQWCEKLYHYSENLVNNARNTNDKMTATTLECDDGISDLKNIFETRATDCEASIGSLFKAVSEVEAINNTFQVNVEAALQEDKSTKLKWMDEFRNVYSTLNETSLEQLVKVQRECETSLLDISSTLTDWKNDLESKMNSNLEVLKEHLENQTAILNSTKNEIDILLCTRKESLETCKGIIEGALNREATNKKEWAEKFLKVEQALSSLDVHCTEYVKTEVENTTQVHSLIKDALKVGSGIARNFIGDSENFIQNMDAVQKQVNFSAPNIFTEKWETMKKTIDASNSKYNDLNTELARCSKAPQKLDGRCSDFEELLKSKFRVNEQPKVSLCIQDMCDSVLKYEDICKSLLAENAEVDESLSNGKTPFEKISESSKMLSNALDSALSVSIQVIEADLLKNLATEEDDEKSNTESQEMKSESTMFDLDATITSASCTEDVVSENLCFMCLKKSTDEALRDDEVFEESLVVPGSSKLVKNKGFQHLKPIGESSGFRSFQSQCPRSPVRRPPIRYAGSLGLPVRKTLQFYDMEKLTNELLENSGDEAEKYVT